MQKFVTQIPNTITVGRILVLPWFLVAFYQSLTEPFDHSFALPAGLFAFMVASDWLDGYLARRFGWITETGKWLDPYADKMVSLCSWMTIVVYLADNNQVGSLSWSAAFGYWALYVTICCQLSYRIGQDWYSQWHYANHGGQSNIFGKVKFNLDLAGIALGGLGIHLMETRGATYQPAMWMMMSCLALAIACASRSIKIKKGETSREETIEVPPLSFRTWAPDTVR